MISPAKAVKVLTQEPPKVQEALIDTLPDQEIRELLRTAVRLLRGEDVA